MSLVNVQNLKKVYQQGKVEVQALRGVSLTIEKGEFLVIAGPSGSGKTTLLNHISGLDQPSSGKIEIDGHDLSKMSKSKLSTLRLHKIGFIFQSFNLIPVLTAKENVEFVMQLQGVAPKERARKALEILEVVGLKDMVNRRPLDLSGGQQQRVAVARAIVSEPALIIADEPTANLDSTTSTALIELMKNLNQQKQITFVFSTHDPLVMHEARRLVHLKDGLIHQDEIQSKQGATLS